MKIRKNHSSGGLNPFEFRCIGERNHKLNIYIFVRCWGGGWQGFIRLDRTIDIMGPRAGAAIVFALMQRNKPGEYRFMAKSLQEMAQTFQTPIRFSIGELVLKVLEQYIYKHPEEWYQWKKYLDVEALPSDQIHVDRPLTLPLLDPSFSEVSP